MNNLNVYENFAVSYYLSDYPKDVGLEKIFDMLREYDDDVLVWGPFFQDDPQDVVDAILVMIENLQKTFVPKEAT